MKAMETVATALIAIVTYSLVVWILGGERKKKNQLTGTETRYKGEAIATLMDRAETALAQIKSKPESFKCGLFVLVVDENNMPDGWLGGEKNAITGLMADPRHLSRLTSIIQDLIQQHGSRVAPPEGMGGAGPPLGGTINTN